MACEPGAAGANELASLSRHFPLFTKTTLAYPIRRSGRAGDRRRLAAKSFRRIDLVGSRDRW